MPFVLLRVPEAHKVPESLRASPQMLERPNPTHRTARWTAYVRDDRCYSHAPPIASLTGAALQPSDAAVDTTTDVVRRAKRTLRRTVGSAAESMSVQGGDAGDAADARSDDSDADDTRRSGGKQANKG